MSDDFDPYAEWLNIAVGNDAPTHYELLGVAVDESDVARIRESYQERYENVHRYTVGNYSDAAIVILEQLAQACECLANPDSRSQYDAELRTSQDDDSAPAAPSVPIEEQGLRQPQPASDAWFYRISGKVFGPIAKRELARLAGETKIAPDTSVRKGTEGNWIVAEHIPGLFSRRRRIENLQAKAKALRAQRDARTAKVRKEKLAGWRDAMANFWAIWTARIDVDFPRLDDPLMVALTIGLLGFLFWVLMALIT